MAAHSGTQLGERGAFADPGSPGLNGPTGSLRRVTRDASRGPVAARQRLDNGTEVVPVLGEVDLATAPALEQALYEVVAEGTGEVIIDLTGCAFLDASGLRVLIAARQRLERAERRLALVMPDPNVLRIFDVAEVRELFEFHPSLRPVRSRPPRSART